MSRARHALLVLLAAAPAVAAGAAAHGPLETIDACIRRLDPELDVGFEKIAARCPELAGSLAASAASAWLPSDWDVPHNRLSASGLEELRALIVSESARSPGARVPDVSHVAGALVTLAPPAQAHDSWWERLRGWMRERLAARADEADRGWIARLIGSLGRHVPGFSIAMGVLAVLALLAGTLLVNALRGAGLLRRLRPRSPRGASARAVERLAPWTVIEAAAPLERPRLLLELIATQLAAQERLPPARALTVHELLHAAQLPQAADRARLAELIAVCEQLAFSGRRPHAAELRLALEYGRELLEVLAVPA